MNYESFTCPITKLIFNDPVVAEDGFIYEYLAIRDHIKNNCTSPQTGDRMGSHLQRVHTVRLMVDQFLGTHPEYQKEQFLHKKPFYLFKSELIDCAQKGDEEQITTYTSFCLTYEFNEKTLFEYACRNFSEEVIMHMIDNSIDYDVEDHHGLRPIHIACRYATPAIVCHLIDKGANIESPDTIGNRPLSYVILYNGNLDLIHFILQKGATINTINTDGFRPIAFAIIRGDLPLFKELLIAGADITLPPRKDVKFLDFLFTYCCSREIIEYAIQNDDIFNQTLGSSEKCLYENNGLTFKDQQELVFMYLNRVFSIPTVDEDFIDNCDTEDSDN